jgi:hypothetical protein
MRSLGRASFCRSDNELFADPLFWLFASTCCGNLGARKKAAATATTAITAAIMAMEVDIGCFMVKKSHRDGGFNCCEGGGRRD